MYTSYYPGPLPSRASPSLNMSSGYTCLLEHFQGVAILYIIIRYAHFSGQKSLSCHMMRNLRQLTYQQNSRCTSSSTAVQRTSDAAAFLPANAASAAYISLVVIARTSSDSLVSYLSRSPYTSHKSPREQHVDLINARIRPAEAFP